MLLVAAITIVSAKAAARPPSARTSWIGRRSARGANASTSTPATAAPNTTSIGDSWLYSMLGALMVEPTAAKVPVTGNSSG